MSAQRWRLWPVAAPLWCYLRLGQWLWGDSTGLAIDSPTEYRVEGDPEQARELLGFGGLLMVAVVFWGATSWFPVLLPTGVWQVSLVGLGVWLPIAYGSWFNQLTITTATEGSSDA